MENLFSSSSQGSFNYLLPFSANAMRNKWRFVIKKHQAARLHYDFRLELPGILKSLVIDESGPTMKANGRKKLVMVGDHNPFYIYREGIIPEGQYGAGEMLVYDRGVYFPRFGGKSKTIDKEVLQAMFQSGEIDFFMMGHKIKGKFKLVKVSTDGKHWELIKMLDEFCHEEDMTKFDKSVISGKTLFDIRNRVNRNDNNYEIFP